MGSSQGFLFTVDQDADIHATNPFTWAHLSLPNIAAVMMTEYREAITCYLYSPSNFTTSRHPQHEMIPIRFLQRHYYDKAIASPLLDAAVLIEHRMDRRLAFAKLNNNNSRKNYSRTALESSLLDKFVGIIFHKGSLRAVNLCGTLAVLDLENPSGHPFVSSEGPFADKLVVLTCYLVESPEGEDLFLVYRCTQLNTTTDIRVFKLDKDNYYKWEQVEQHRRCCSLRWIQPFSGRPCLPQQIATYFCRLHQPLP